jgi:hypothetical protein
MFFTSVNRVHWANKHRNSIARPGHLGRYFSSSIWLGRTMTQEAESTKTLMFSAWLLNNVMASAYPQIILTYLGTI